MVLFNFIPIFLTSSKFTPFSAKILIFRGGVKVELDCTVNVSSVTTDDTYLSSTCTDLSLHGSREYHSRVGFRLFSVDFIGFLSQVSSAQ